jgi:hypothetical protein
LKRQLKDLIDERKENYKTRTKSMKIEIQLIVLMMIIIGHDLCLYRQRDIALWVGYDQIFPKAMSSGVRVRMGKIELMHIQAHT